MTERLTGDNLRRYELQKRTETRQGYASQYFELNQLFATKPMEFFRRHAVLPPSSAGDQAPVDRGSVWQDTATMKAVTGGSRGATAEVRWKAIPRDRGVIRVNFVRKVSGNEKGAVTFQAGDVGVPIYFLPWESLSVVSLAIPDTNGALYEPDDPDSPGLFFTAAINGCSVFVKGAPTRPEIFHAGIDGGFASGVSAVSFWQDRMRAILAKQGPGGGHLGAAREINKEDYIKNPRHTDPTTTATATAFEEWLKSNQSTEFRVQMVSPWACVFGIRYGRSWSFYLQENATVTVQRFVRKRDTTSGTSSNGTAIRTLKSTGEAVSRSDETRKSKLFGLIPRNERIYTLTQHTSRPLIVRDFYPGAGGGRIQIADSVKRV